ncbi:oligosaccharide flippase family protein [bacterium]|nr:oligosaccharide flippase family protein [bacterium]
MEKFGIVSFAQAFIQYFIIATDYGFNLSAPREISIHHKDPHKISEIFSSVMILKLFFLFISILILLSVICIIPKFQEDSNIYLFSFGMVAGYILFPAWFFQGMEKMGYITTLNIIAKLIFTISIFIFVRSESDYYKVPLINSLGFITTGIIALWIVFKTFRVKLQFPDTTILISHLKNSFYFFLSRISVSIYTISNTFILGLLTTNTLTGYYEAANKLIKAVSALNQPIVNAIYPYMCRTKNKSFYKKIFSGWVSIGICIFIITFFGNYYIISTVYGSNFGQTAQILRFLSIQFPLVFTSVLLGLPFLAAFGYTKFFNFTVVFGSIWHILALCIIIPIMKAYQEAGIYLLVFVTILTETIILLARVYGVRKYSLW